MNPLYMWKDLAEKYNNKIALFSESSNFSLTYKDLYSHIFIFAKNLKKYGIENGNKICLFAENSPQWIVADQAIMSLGAICVPRQSVESKTELEYIYTHSNADALISDKMELIEHFIQNFPSIKFAIYIGNEKFDEEVSFKNQKIYDYKTFSTDLETDNIIIPDINPDDTSLIVYTSGTSGKPKGVMHSYKTIMTILTDFYDRVSINEPGLCVGFPPLWHVAPRFHDFSKLLTGSKIIYTNYNNYINTLKKYKPIYFLCVPKLFSALYEECNALIKSKGIIYRKIFDFCYKISSRKYINNNKLYNFIDNVAYMFLYKNIKKQYTSENSVITVTGASMSPEIELFFNILRIRILNYYGQTECPLIAIPSSKNPALYSVGNSCNNVYVKIIDIETGETLSANKPGTILVKSSHTMQGYFKNSDETNKVLSQDGFLNTGDIGSFDEKGNIHITGRVKDIIILDNGENIEPISIENLCLNLPFIKRIVLAGQDKPYLSAIILPEYSETAIKGLKLDDLKEFILKEVNKQIASRKHFRWIERIRNILIIDEDFSVENECLTNSLKIKRYKIYEKYSQQIEDMYKTSPLI